MRLIEGLKLVYRAYKYRNSGDKGGIAYLNASIKPGQIVFDVGAHKGGYLYWMRKCVGTNGRVFAFEPQSDLYNYLNKIKYLFNWTNVNIEHLALSDVVGNVTLYIPVNKVSKGSSPGATVVENKEGLHFGKTEIVQTQTIDYYCDTYKLKPNFLKIDVEGNELHVLKGAKNILRNFKPKILIEIEARHVGKERVMETFNFLQALDYKGLFIKNDQFINLELFDFEKHQNFKDKSNYCNNFIFE
jgi:FkbM family methyltransferase